MNHIHQASKKVRTNHQEQQNAQETSVQKRGLQQEQRTSQQVKEYIELNAFLKSKGLATTGGQAKLLIRSGAVKVNGVVETRNKKKLRDGDVVEVEGNVFKVSLS
ncbi:RNA-binding S4 domain-containing protein [Candidatus Woesearchaeota archaeon]|nr:MAG: RNA-binding S4 domain-containing protein [Candidatus Woesearchaeota archaeon]